MAPATNLDPCLAALERLREAGFELTPQRRAIVAELVGDRSHPTARELFERLRQREHVVPKKNIGVSFATVSPHDHAVCDGCGAVFDAPVAPHAGGRRAAPVEGFAVRSVERVYRGRCGACAALAGAIPSF